MKLFHACTGELVAQYAESGCIRRPVRGFTTPAGAMAWAMQVGRKVIYEIDADDLECHKLPDEHNDFGEAWWVDADVLIERARCVLDCESLSKKKKKQKAAAEKKLVAADLPDDQLAWFEEWWKKVWRKDAKELARRSWLKSVTDRATYELVKKGTEMQLPEMLSREPKFRPMMVTWLNQRRWEDEPAEATPQIQQQSLIPEFRASRPLVENVPWSRSDGQDNAMWSESQDDSGIVF